MVTGSFTYGYMLLHLYGLRVIASCVPYVPRAVAPQVLLEEAQHEDYVLCNALKARRFAHSACAEREPSVSRA